MSKDNNFSTRDNPYAHPALDNEPFDDGKVVKDADRTIKVAVGILVVVIVAAIGAGVWLLGADHGSGNDTTPSTEETSQQTDQGTGGNDSKWSENNDNGSDDVPALGGNGSDSDQSSVSTADDDKASKSGEDEADDSDDADSKDDDADHVHDYVAQYKTVHHKAVTHKKHHPATYKQETTYHTVCNTCGKVIDGKAESHIKKTGHSGFTKDMPVVKNVIAKKAYDEVIVDKKAYDENKLTGYKCVHCDKKLTVKEMKKLQADAKKKAKEDKKSDKKDSKSKSDASSATTLEAAPAKVVK